MVCEDLYLLVCIAGIDSQSGPMYGFCRIRKMVDEKECFSATCLMYAKLKHTLRQVLRSIGLDVRRYNPSCPDLERMLTLYGVDTIFDIGANAGQSGDHFRFLGFKGKIVSFEPITDLFQKIEAKASRDPLWCVENVALGLKAGKAEINVSGGHAGASSLLEMTDNVINNAPDQIVFTKEQVNVTTLSSMLAKHYPYGDRCFLKIDVQGYEKNVLDGGLDSIDRVIGMKVELSLVENYKGEPLLTDMLPFLCDLGFRSVSFENGWGNAKSGELYQVDCIVFRTDVYAK